MKSIKPQQLILSSEFPLESGDQGMFCFGLFQRQAYNSQTHNIFTFKTFSIGANQRYFSKAQLEVNNSMHYPPVGNDFAGGKSTLSSFDVVQFRV